MYKNIINYLKELLVLVLYCYKLVLIINVQYYSRVIILFMEYRYELICELKLRVVIIKKNRIVYNGVMGICVRVFG